MTKADHINLIREYNEAKTAYVRCMKKDQIARAEAYMNLMQTIAEALDSKPEPQLEFAFEATNDG